MIIITQTRTSTELIRTQESHLLLVYKILSVYKLAHLTLKRHLAIL